VDLRQLQQQNMDATAGDAPLFHTGGDVVVALVEELGEVAREIALLERIGSKATWELASSTPRLAKELTQVLNLVCVLANRYGIDLAAAYDENP
jgi:NTP pyrophosphatase (non-canonical NTP hydrolase)